MGINCKRIETLQSLIKDLDAKAIEVLKNDLAKGEITLNQFNRELTRLAQDSMNRQIENRFEQLFLKMNKKYNDSQ